MKFLELNTQCPVIPGFMDESEKQWCGKCRNWHYLGPITQKHMELCEGDPTITLMKVEQWYKETYRR